MPIVEVEEQETTNSMPPPAPRAINIEKVLGVEAAGLPGTNGSLDLQKLPGVTSKIAKQMEAMGIAELEDILDLGVEGLQDIRGVASVRAETIYGAALEAISA